MQNMLGKCCIQPLATEVVVVARGIYDIIEVYVNTLYQMNYDIMKQSFR